MSRWWVDAYWPREGTTSSIGPFETWDAAWTEKSRREAEQRPAFSPYTNYRWSAQSILYRWEYTVREETDEPRRTGPEDDDGRHA